MASVDDKGVESLFSKELMLTVTTGIKELSADKMPYQLLQNKPNPSDEATTISVLVNKQMKYKEAYISITDLSGKEVKRMSLELKEGINEVEYNHGYHMSGTFIYTLIIDGKHLQSKKMVFSN